MFEVPTQLMFHTTKIIKRYIRQVNTINVYDIC